MTRTFLLATTLLVGVLAAPANAAISAGPTIGGFATFTDSNTGRNWMRLDSFFDVSPNAMLAAATPAGFTLANRSDVEGLLGTLPIDAGQWAGVEAITGGAPNRPLIWAFFGPLSTSGNYGYAFAYDTYSEWNFADDVAGQNDVQNGGTLEADMTIWAYASGDVDPVPEPASWAMLIAGFGLVGAAMRRRAAAVAA